MTKTGKNKILWIKWAMWQDVIRYFSISIFSLFYDNFILEIWASKSLFSINEGLPSKASYSIYISKFNHQIFSNCIININFPQYYITIKSFIHRGHYIKVYWVHLIYPWSERCFCTTFKIHKLNTKYLTMKY